MPQCLRDTLGTDTRALPRVQLRPAVAELMDAVRALPPLSMEAVGAAARLALPQIGCSNPGCV